MKEYFCKVGRDITITGITILIGYKENDDYYILQGKDYKKVKDRFNVEPSLYLPEPTLLEENILSALVDGLLECGAKPNKPIENPSELRAIKYHLEDMRKLVFGDKQGKGEQ